MWLLFVPGKAAEPVPGLWMAQQRGKGRRRDEMDSLESQEDGGVVLCYFFFYSAHEVILEDVIQRWHSQLRFK